MKSVELAQLVRARRNVVLAFVPTGDEDEEFMARRQADREWAESPDVLELMAELEAISPTPEPLPEPSAGETTEAAPSEADPLPRPELTDTIPAAAPPEAPESPA